MLYFYWKEVLIMKYINKLNDIELENFFYKYFATNSPNRVKGIRIVRHSMEIEITVWYNNKIEKYCFSDFSPIKKWVKFLYSKFGNSYLKDYNTFRKSYLKIKFEEEKSKAAINNKINYMNYPKDEKNEAYKNELEEIKMIYAHRLEELKKFVKELKEHEKE